VKRNVLFDPDAERPLYLEVTRANVNDITVAHAMPIQSGATYVFDLGYYHYAWWAKLDAAGCRIVSRLKKNTPFASPAKTPARGLDAALRPHRPPARTARRQPQNPSPIRS